MQDSFQETPATQSWVDHTPKLLEDVSLRKMNSKTPITNSQALTLKPINKLSIKQDQISSEDTVPPLNWLTIQQFMKSGALLSGRLI